MQPKPSADTVRPCEPRRRVSMGISQPQTRRVSARARPAWALAIIIGVLATAATSIAAAERLAAGVQLIPGSFVPGQQPDGNSIVLDAPAGLVVIDTGRHAEHTQRLLDAATRTGRPIAAIVNTHWHLDHVGGNPLLRARYPEVQVYAGTAVHDALRGFLANYRAQLVAASTAPAADTASVSAWRREIALIDAGELLAPTVPVTESGRRRIAGRMLQLHLERNAVTGSDLWLFDPQTRLLLAGDLVTLPVPFFDTACPARWRSALNRLAAVRFVRLVPGHGPPLRPRQFAVYRRAFGALLDCAATTRSKEECAAGWLHDIGDLVPAGEQAFARSLLDYYLTEKGDRFISCEAPETGDSPQR